MSSKHSTKQHISAQYCAKQMSETWRKKIQEFLRYSNFVLGYFILPHPAIPVFGADFRNVRHWHNKTMDTGKDCSSRI